MRILTAVLILFFCVSKLLSTANLAFAAEPTQGSVVMKTDVVYGIVDSIEMKLDIAFPVVQGSSSRPCIVVIHGGAWRQGDKASHRGGIQELAKHGYVAASLAYRFCPDHRFPAQVHDVKRAVRFLRSESKQFGIDTERFGAVGYSAGAHLAMMLGVTDIKDGLEGQEIWSRPIDQPSKVQAVVSFYGPTDLTQQNIPAISVPLVADFIGGLKTDLGDVYKNASPISFVDSTDAPMLLFQGTSDPLVPYQQAILMSEKISGVGLDGRMELFFGAGHGWGGSMAEKTRKETWQFFDTQLR